MTVAERRVRWIARLKAAAAADLTGYARDSGMKFVIVGSFARGDVVATSDLELFVDGP